MQSYLLSNPGTVVGAFVLYCLVGLAVGSLLAVVYWMWSRRPDMPQGFFRHPPSRTTAAVIAAASTVAFVVIGARAELLAFHRIDITPTQVHLHYALPDRTTTLERSEIERVALGIGSEKGPTVRLVLYKRGGSRYESAPTPRQRFDQARAAVDTTGGTR